MLKSGSTSVVGESDPSNRIVQPILVADKQNDCSVSTSPTTARLESLGWSNLTSIKNDSKTPVNSGVSPDGLSQATQNYPYFQTEKIGSVRIGAEGLTNVSPDLQTTPPYPIAESEPNMPALQNCEVWAAEGTRLQKAACEKFVESWTCDPEYSEEYELAGTILSQNARFLLDEDGVVEARRLKLDTAVKELYGKR